MTIQVRLFGTLRKHRPAGAAGREFPVELPDGADIHCLVAQLGIPLEGGEGQLVAAINDQQVDLHARLEEGDVVALFEPLAGG